MNENPLWEYRVIGLGRWWGGPGDEALEEA